MTIQFTEDQAMLLAVASDFCRRHSPMETVRASLDRDGMDEATWREMVALGWLGVNVPADFGGLDLGFSGVTPIIESMGRYLMASPYIGSVCVSETLAGCGSPEQKAAWLPRLVSGCVGAMALSEPDGSWELEHIDARAEVCGDRLCLEGQKCFVTDADVAAVLLASVNLGGSARLVLIARDQVPPDALARETVIDQTRRSFRLWLDDMEIPVSQLLPGADFRRIELISMLALCAEITGGMAGCLHLIVEYLNTRRAFGRAIGSYQALKHPAVDILLGLEAARSHLYQAATVLAIGDVDEAERALRMAKAQGSEAFAFAGDRAVQFHGGFGFTFECDAQLYLRRALWCQYQFGDEAHHRRLLAPLLLDEAPGGAI